MIKVIITDDSLILRNGLKTILEQDEEINVIGCTENGKEALELCQKELPDLVLMDIRMPICDGIEGTKLIKEYNQSVKVLVITTFEDEEYLKKVLSNGADGYVLKDISEKDLINIIRSTVNGFSTIQNNVFSNIKSQYKTEHKEKTEKLDFKSLKLSGRDIEVIQLIVDGRNNKEIGKILHLVEGSIRNQISLILDKLNLKDRTQLAVFAVKNNLV